MRRPPRRRAPPRRSRAALPLKAEAVAIVDAASSRTIAQTPLQGVADLVTSGGSRWALLDRESKLVQLDARTGKPGKSVDLPFAAGGVAASATDIWVTEAGGPGLVRIDPRTAQIVKRLEVPDRAGEGTAVAVGAGSVWLGRGAEVFRVDPASGKVSARFAAPYAADRLAADDNAVWIASNSDGQLYEIDPATDTIVAKPKLHAYVTDLTLGGGAAWVAVTPEDRVYQLNSDDGSVQASFPAGPGPESVAYTDGALIVANGRDGLLSRIDLTTSERQARATGDASPMLVRSDGDAVWVASVAAVPVPVPLADGNEVRVSLPGDDLSMDPAAASGPVNYQLAYLTCMRLETYADAAGAAGRELVPDAAVAAPAVSSDGRTYTFQIRPGLRFSPPSGAPITADTFRATLERALSPALGQQMPATTLLHDLVGLDDYRAGRTKHVSGIVADADRLAITIAHPAGDLRARLAQTFSCAVPAGTPVVPDGVTTPLASGGPYHIVANGPFRTVLERNPAYTGSRPRKPQRIVYEKGIATARATALLDGGRIDYVPYDFDFVGPLAAGGDLDRKYGPDSSEAAAGRQRYYPTPIPGLDLLAFNTRRGLFADVRVRQAVNAALDRPAIAAVWREPPSDRYVPPAVLDSANGSSYPVDGPDLVRARKLAHGVSGTAVLYFCGGSEGRRIGAIIRANLAEIGIRVRATPSQDCRLGDDPKRDRADLMLISPSTAVIDPGPFVGATVGRDEAFGSGLLPPGWWTDAALTREIDRAGQLQGPARTAAYGALQTRLLEAAPFASIGSWTAPEYVSPRIGCRVFSGGINALDLAAVCPQPPTS